LSIVSGGLLDERGGPVLVWFMAQISNPLHGTGLQAFKFGSQV
jgi:hypothetical protein